MALVAYVALLPVAAPESAYAQGAEPEVLEIPIPGSPVVLRFVTVQGGELRLGSPPDEVGRDEDEGPERTVTLSPFWIGTTEVPHEAFALFRHRRLDSNAATAAAGPFDPDAVTRPSPPYEDPSHGMGRDGMPATGMTRLSALQFARWLSEKTGRLFRLPTEAEWEYACELDSPPEPLPSTESAWLAENSAGSLHPVGEQAPGGLGIHDLRGNAAEWVLDEYVAGAYGELSVRPPATDPVGGRPGRGRGIVRGGAFDDAPDDARCAERFPETPAWKRRDPQVPKSRWWNTDSPHVGFRLVTPAETLGMDQIRSYWTELLGN